jgi:hypothetical protein
VEAPNRPPLAGGGEPKREGDAPKAGAEEEAGDCAPKAGVEEAKEKGAGEEVGGCRRTVGQSSYHGVEVKARHVDWGDNLGIHLCSLALSLCFDAW